MSWGANEPGLLCLANRVCVEWYAKACVYEKLLVIAVVKRLARGLSGCVCEKEVAKC